MSLSLTTQHLQTRGGGFLFSLHVLCIENRVTLKGCVCKLYIRVKNDIELHIQMYATQPPLHMCVCVFIAVHVMKGM